MSWQGARSVRTSEPPVKAVSQIVGVFIRPKAETIATNVTQARPGVSQGLHLLQLEGEHDTEYNRISRDASPCPAQG